MKKLAGIGLGLFLSIAAFAQPGWNYEGLTPAQQEEAQTKMVTMGDDVNANRFEDAAKKTDWLVENCPKVHKSLYQNGYSVSVVYTQPPQKSKRGQKINKSPIQGISETLKIEYRTPSSLKDNKEEYKHLKELDADIAIVVAYGQIIPKEYLSLVKKGFINIHASLLPKWSRSPQGGAGFPRWDFQKGNTPRRREPRAQKAPSPTPRGVAPAKRPPARQDSSAQPREFPPPSVRKPKPPPQKPATPREISNAWEKL